MARRSWTTRTLSAPTRTEARTESQTGTPAAWPGRWWCWRWGRSIRCEQGFHYLLDAPGVATRNHHIPLSSKPVRRNNSHRDPFLPKHRYELIGVFASWVGTHNHRSCNGSHGWIPSATSTHRAVWHATVGRTDLAMPDR